MGGAYPSEARSWSALGVGSIRLHAESNGGVGSREWGSGEREMGERLLVIGAVRSGGLISYHGKQ